MVIGSKTALDIAGATQDWYNEKSDYTYDTLTCGAGKKCGHYTQVKILKERIKRNCIWPTGLFHKKHFRTGNILFLFLDFQR